MSIDHYPMPSYAAYIWTRANKLTLGLPATGQNERGHSVALEYDIAVLKNMCAATPDNTERLSNAERKTLRALFLLLNTLHEREMAKVEQTLGKTGAPVQYDLEQIMKSWGGQVKVIGKKDAPKDLTLDDLGL